LHCSDVLTSPDKGWRLIAPLVVVDAPIDIASLTPGCSAVTLARALLLKGGPEVHHLLAVLVDLGLEFTELLELYWPRPLGGRHRGPPCGGPVGSTC
jgi:DNA-binding phage protein